MKSFFYLKMLSNDKTPPLPPSPPGGGGVFPVICNYGLREKYKTSSPDPPPPPVSFIFSGYFLEILRYQFLSAFFGSNIKKKHKETSRNP